MHVCKRRFELGCALLTEFEEDVLVDKTVPTFGAEMTEDTIVTLVGC